MCMRKLYIKDVSIPKTKFDQVAKDYKDFHKKNSGVEVTNLVLDYDFKNYPTVLDSDGDDRPTDALLRSLVALGEEKYGKYGFDHLTLEIHQDNWKSGKTATRKGIWGTNYSYRYGPYHIQYNRWDNKNLANSFGTINHEDDHAYDALILTEIGVNVNPILKVENYDRNTTHGQPIAYHGYVRYQENAQKLKVLSPYLIAAYAKRVKRHEEELKKQITGLQKTVVSLLEKLVYQLQQKLNQKNGNPQ